MDGGALAAEENETPRDGAVMVALLRADAEVPVKGLYGEEGDRMRLKPENGDHEQLVLPAEDVRIRGRGVYGVRSSRGRAAGGGA